MSKWGIAASIAAAVGVGAITIDSKTIGNFIYENYSVPHLERFHEEGTAARKEEVEQTIESVFGQLAADYNEATSSSRHEEMYEIIAREFPGLAREYHARVAEQTWQNIDTIMSMTVPIETQFVEVGQADPSPDIRSSGIGFVVNNLLITASHIIEEPESRPVYFGGMRIRQTIQVSEKRISADGVDLEEPIYQSVSGEGDDVAVFQLPEILCERYCQGSFKTSDDNYLGRPVLWAGSPGGIGNTVRFSTIGKIGSNNPGFEDAIGLSTYVVPGSSGGAMWGTDEHGELELLGMISFVQGKMGHYVPIQNIPITMTQVQQFLQAQNQAGPTYTFLNP